MDLDPFAARPLGRFGRFGPVGTGWDRVVQRTVILFSWFVSGGESRLKGD